MAPRRNWRALAQDDRGQSVAIEVKGTNFDELVINDFLHLEKMSDSEWCLIIESIKGERFHLSIREASARRHAMVTIVQEIDWRDVPIAHLPLPLRDKYRTRKEG